MSEDSGSPYKECILPLNNTTTIRVLHLKPGDKNDQIEGSLRRLDLYTEPPPQYNCVSYVWGDPKTTKLAIINTRCVTITKNLYDVLRHIRSKTDTVIIWADAICIDQSDNREKSSQVALMTEIYRQCSKVLIWLGLPEPGSLTGNPFEFLEHFVAGKHFYDFPGFARDKPTGLWTWKEHEACDNMLDDFLQVVNSPWWTRAWTVQECLLPRHSLIMFGTWTVTWDYMLKAHFMKNSHGDGPVQCCKESVDVFNPRQLFAINEWMWHPGRVQRFGKVLRGNSTTILLLPIPPSLLKPTMSRPSRQDILYAISSDASSLPRL
jgi:Heterokaryon incompatibility protein (HET)